jgi:hypothetical protein
VRLAFVMDLPNEAGRMPQAVPSHQQHQADTRHIPHKQQRQESVIHLILYSSSTVHWLGHIHLPITKEIFSATNNRVACSGDSRRETRHSPMPHQGMSRLSLQAAIKLCVCGGA